MSVYTVAKFLLRFLGPSCFNTTTCILAGYFSSMNEQLFFPQPPNPGRKIKIEKIDTTTEIIAKHHKEGLQVGMGLGAGTRNFARVREQHVKCNLYSIPIAADSKG